MKWPWVSRRAYDLLVEQNMALRRESETGQVSLDTFELAIETLGDLKESNRQWADHARRIERREHGMSELAREPRTPAQLETMPQELREYIASFRDSPGIRKSMKAVAFQRHSAGESWDEIIEAVIVPEEPRERIMGAEDDETGGAGDHEGTTEEGAGRA